MNGWFLLVFLTIMYQLEIKITLIITEYLWWLLLKNDFPYLFLFSNYQYLIFIGFLYLHEESSQLQYQAFSIARHAINRARIQKFHSGLTFFFLCFRSQTPTIYRKARKEMWPSSFLFTIFASSRIFRHLFQVLQLRWISSIFNRCACNYHTLTR